MDQHVRWSPKCAPQAVGQAANLLLEDHLLRQRQPCPAPFDREVRREVTGAEEDRADFVLQVGRHMVIGLVDRDLIRDQLLDKRTGPIPDLDLPVAQ